MIYRSGTINLVGASFDAGIFATAPGSATVTTLSGTSITVSQEFSTDTAQGGIEAFASRGATTVTSTLLGHLREDARSRAEFLTLAHTEPTAMR